ncbi:hypothetical protein M404DRAFT_23866 [Pisolithus tinctorius Marx 270]|uniref:Uncharacterized protein n=1 Tax=Pisolithus tinctorius Marx 270 TaxID=870435 RepID=A0A0C3P2Y4_PISTI|nr:hypothetical protein M404DRAFT_23866 [Pisolithus tinctorius Marx 270]
METEEVNNKWEVGEEEEEPATPHKGPSGRAALAFEGTVEAVEWMAEAMEWTADEWGLYHTWAEWAEMRRREDAHEARVAKFKCTGGGWKRTQLEVVEDKNEEVDEGVEGDNEGEEEVGGEQEGGEGQEGGEEQVMEE